MTNSARKPGAQLMRVLRQRRGWSLLDEAKALREAARRRRMPTIATGSLITIKRTIARWENDAVRPAERYQLLLAEVFAEHDGSILFGPGSDFDQLMTAFAHYEITAQRISELRDFTAATLTRGSAGLLAYLSPALSTELVKALADPRSADDRLAARLATAVADLNSRVGAVPFVRLQIGLAPIAEACRGLLAGEVPQEARRQFLVVATTAYTLAARLAFESYDDASSADYYAQALSAAGRLPDLRHRAAVRTSHAMVTLYATGDLPKAQAIADEAVHDARRGSSARIRSRALALRAEMTARAANTHRAFAALHDAWHEIDHTSDKDTAPGAFDAGRLHGFEGVCQLYAGDSAKAEGQFADSAATLTRPRDAVQRGIVRTDQAKARILLAAPEAATALLHECIDLSAGTRGRVSAQRIREARLALSPWRSERFVTELDDHIHTASIAGA
jgi:transcriptional regulator with XRE-family HTH domain